MANVVRSAKLASHWKERELTAYNITIASVAPDEFFPSPDPSLDHIDTAILNSPPSSHADISDTALGYFGYLGMATRAEKVQESLVDNFVFKTLRLLGFDEDQVSLFMYHTIPFNICGKATRVAKMNVCVFHYPNLVLLVAISGGTANAVNVEAQIVAMAIAAFQYNNAQRIECRLDPLAVMTIPCIRMSGTRPTFYLVPVTTELNEAVIAGRYPEHTTVVLRCATVVADTPTFVGMEDTEYRRFALKRFLAFKELAKSHWVHVVRGMKVTP